MDVLMAIVIGFIIVVAGYVGYHASQAPPEAGGHDISPELEVFNTETKSMQSFNQVTIKSVS
ncbi:MAG: hypothetical protein VW081_03270 [Nitrosopumilus sp.]|nr:MAG: hypothetical protein EA443_00535 [Nitrosopumilus sp.]